MLQKTDNTSDGYLLLIVPVLKDNDILEHILLEYLLHSTIFCIN